MRHGLLLRRSEGAGQACRLIATGLIFTVLQSAASAAEGAADFAAYRAEALRPLEAPFSEAEAACRADPKFQNYQQRLRLIDEVVDRLSARLQSVRTAALSALADVGAAAAGAATAETPALAGPKPLDAFFAYDRQFAEPLPMPSAAAADHPVLGRYYDASMKAAADFVAATGGSIVTADEGLTTELLEACLVLPLLHVSDRQWSAQHVETIPKWMKGTESLHTLETFCLRAGRPLSAYRFALRRGPAAQQKLSCPAYLSGAADELTAHSNYRAAFHCLQAAARSAQEEAQTTTAMALRIRMADALAMLGRPQAAADEIRQLMDTHPDSEQFGPMAVLRLRYLFEAWQFEAVAEEAEPLQAHEACRQQWPRILFTSWAAHRRSQKWDEADKLRASFHKRFPEHPLGAHMYFAAAARALSAGRPDEAARLLKIIEDRYPQNPLLPKVKELQQRLAPAKSKQSDP